MNYETVIGIEIHCELNTKSKMFSPAPNAFGATPNTLVSPIDLGFPGVMPRVNKKAVELAIRASTALHCTIDHELWFDRKNYFYPDLPKGYQITQSDRPIGSQGYVDIEVQGTTKRIRINRLHLEEDTAKQTHLTDYTLLNYNRGGVPLIEIVSEADIRSAEEAVAYVDTLRLNLLYTDVSDVKMEEGSMRCDINISIRPYGTTKFGTKTEIKNLNSLSNVQKAIEFEVSRQQELLLSGGVVEQETRRFDEGLRQTILMRKKTDAIDYKYFTEPNILPIKLDPTWVKSIQDQMPELPDVKKHRYQHTFGLSPLDANAIIQDKAIAEYIDQALTLTKEAKLVTNWVLTDVQGYLNKANIPLSQSPLTPSYLVELIELITKGTISSKQAKQVFEWVMTERKSPSIIVKEHGLEQNSNQDELRNMVNQVLNENPSAVTTFHQGKDNIVGFLVGQVMKKTKGQANPGLTNQLLKDELMKRKP